MVTLGKSLSYGNLEEVGDSEEWQGGTRLPIWGVKRLRTGYHDKHWTREDKPAEAGAGERTQGTDQMAAKNFLLQS